ncbi:MAG: hypothetical protein ACLGPM_12225 [Acidobacteriota bacterium]
MNQHSALVLNIRSYAGFLIALCPIGFGWLLAFRSKAMVGFFASENERWSSRLSRGLAICGWISLVAGSLILVGWLILLGIIALKLT